MVVVGGGRLGGGRGGGAVSFDLLERVHGHLAVLALAALLHPVVTLGRRKRVTRGTRWAVGAGAGLLLVAYAGGWWLYPEYRELVKPDLPVEVSLLFERKEHLAWMALALAAGGVGVLFGRPEAWRTGRALLVAGWCCGAVAAVLGVVVAAS